MFSIIKLLCVFPLLLPALAAPALEKRAAPTVSMSSPQATIIGGSSGNVETFDGIPFAQPPFEALRLKPPQTLTSSLGTVTATGSAKVCPQFFFSINASGFPTNVLGTVLDLPLF
jgi:hypothetical protein